jgi:hypothetical protein
MHRLSTDGITLVAGVRQGSGAIVNGSFLGGLDGIPVVVSRNNCQVADSSTEAYLAKSFSPFIENLLPHPERPTPPQWHRALPATLPTHRRTHLPATSARKRFPAHLAAAGREKRRAVRHRPRGKTGT